MKSDNRSWIAVFNFYERSKVSIVTCTARNKFLAHRAFRESLTMDASLLDDSGNLLPHRLLLLQQIKPGTENDAVVAVAAHIDPSNAWDMEAFTR